MSVGIIGNPEDFFYDGKNTVKLDVERLTKDDLHGTGCVLSAAITAYLGLGRPLTSAVEEAKEFIGKTILGGIRSGTGQASVDPLAVLHQNAERWELFQRVSRAIAHDARSLQDLLHCS